MSPCSLSVAFLLLKTPVRSGSKDNGWLKRSEFVVWLNPCVVLMHGFSFYFQPLQHNSSD